MKGVRAMVDAIPQLIAGKSGLALTPNGAESMQLAVSYSFDKNRPGDQTAIVKALVLDIPKLCERLGVRPTESDAAAVGTKPARV